MTELKQVLQTRQTDKVLVNPDKPLPVGASHRDAVDALLADTAWAPFHYPAGKHHRENAEQLDGPMPWRFYKVDTPGCRKLAQELRASSPAADKIIAMLSGADVLVQVTWLPDPIAEQTPPPEDSFIGSRRNMEHIAGAAAAVQSFLLLATEAGYRTYWSSGGALRDAEVITRLQIPREEMLLGSLFLFPQDVGDALVKPGAWRDKRGEVTGWSAWRDI